MINDRVTRIPRTHEEKEVDFRKDKEYMQHYWKCEKNHIIGKEFNECAICLYDGLKYANDRVENKIKK